jgi:hypothetical protein
MRVLRNVKWVHVVCILAVTLMSIGVASLSDATQCVHCETEEGPCALGGDYDNCMTYQDICAEWGSCPRGPSFSF